MAADLRGRHRPWVNADGIQTPAESAVPMINAPGNMDGHAYMGQTAVAGFGMAPGGQQAPGMVDHGARRPMDAYGYNVAQRIPMGQVWGDAMDGALPGIQDPLGQFRQQHLHGHPETQFDTIDLRSQLQQAHPIPQGIQPLQPQSAMGDMQDPTRKSVFALDNYKVSKLDSAIPGQNLNDPLAAPVDDRDGAGNGMKWNGMSYSCNRCSMAFFKKKQLMSHFRAVHSQASVFPCEICSEGFDDKERLTVHMRSRHADRRLFECSMCNATPFLNSQNLEKHKQMVHEDRRPYSCPRCEFAFTTKNNLEKHIRTVHEKIRPFRCEHCPSAFDTRNNLQKHTKTVHDKLRPYRCSQCDTSFGQKSHLDRHVKTVHENYRPFSCPQCTSTFGRKSHLGVHIRTVHENLRPYACDLCGATFGEKGTLTTHKKRVHKDDAGAGPPKRLF
mmetsp:Transcript_7228/g.32063  ORF Transcript_7228/g.32063 Transcript_7228/m.32063 type:complete len:443 (-) Transcript_7228:1373-2701(-)|eukprot:CAMPEP_0113959360 /NCGR_PEP_ID=MMETSP0011_2-20120614/4104_1 /TAXON_ID=101924 /ORGANISM="Rhodosorus marinus" /LENGTH=442 /DNA_ID=CAMNT_0000970669 /DNA_START=163 /DNA_END=1491 /DNA_ORIENTATION=- /assembly_acc=CAM_ASM_000156